MLSVKRFVELWAYAVTYGVQLRPFYFLTLIIFFISTMCSLFLMQSSECKSLKNDGSEFVVFCSTSNEGVFSVCYSVLNLLRSYEVGHFQGLEINFENRGLYFEPRWGLNWWNYYFEPIFLGRKNNDIVVKDPGNFKKFFAWYDCSYRKEASTLIQKYIRIKPNILTKINEFEKTNFKDSFVIGVHFRGTDKMGFDRPGVSAQQMRLNFYEKMVQEVEMSMKSYGNKNYKIFVATDDEKFLALMLKKFNERVCYNQSVKRSKNGKATHFDFFQDKYVSGLNALVDCVLLSRVNLLIKTEGSCLSCWSTYFNPTLVFKDVKMVNAQS